MHTRWLAIFVAAFVGASLLTWVSYDPSLVDGPDDPAFYWRMAAGETVHAPFGYRPLVPWLVRLSPIGGHAGFILVSSLFVGVAMATTWVWLRSHVSGGRATFALAVVAFAGPMTFALYRPYGTDTLLIAGLAVGAWAADRARWDLFALAGFVTVVGREAALVLACVPALEMLEQRRLDRRLVIAAIAPAAAFVCVRVGVDALPRPLQRPEEIFAYRASVDGSLMRSVWFAIRDSFGPAWVAVALSWRTLPATMRVWAIPAALGAASCLIASDWSRLLAPALPLIAASVAMLDLPFVGPDRTTSQTSVASAPS